MCVCRWLPTYFPPRYRWLSICSPPSCLVTDDFPPTSHLLPTCFPPYIRTTTGRGSYAVYRICTSTLHGLLSCVAHYSFIYQERTSALEGSFFEFFHVCTSRMRSICVFSRGSVSAFIDVSPLPLMIWEGDSVRCPTASRLGSVSGLSSCALLLSETLIGQGCVRVAFRSLLATKTQRNNDAGGAHPTSTTQRVGTGKPPFCGTGRARNGLPPDQFRVVTFQIAIQEYQERVFGK